MHQPAVCWALMLNCCIHTVEPHRVMSPLGNRAAPKSEMFITVEIIQLFSEYK